MLPITPGDAVIAVQNSKVQNTKDFQAKISKLIKSGKKIHTINYCGFE